MTPALLREAAAMFDADTQCCSERLNGPGHATSCIVTRLRMAADQMEGMVLVPLEPTEAMKKAAFGGVQYGGRTGPITKDFLRQAAAIMTYKAMITAVRKTEQEG